MSNLDNIINKIIEDAEDKAALIKEEAREKAQSIVEKRVADAEDLKQKALKRAEAEAAMTTERIVGNADLKSRDMLLSAKQSVIARVLDEAKEVLLSLSDEDYVKVLEKKLQDIDRSEAPLLLVPVGKKQVLEGKSMGLSVQESDDVKSGFCVDYKGTTINNDFTELVDYLKDDLEAEIIQILSKG